DEARADDAAAPADPMPPSPAGELAAAGPDAPFFDVPLAADPDAGS
ncbi:MAG: hypothetical protein JWO31_1045, partial [Phycisphaerales bacterium]|nr:hypothetical protein [Phycisphaerales bacterium]